MLSRRVLVVDDDSQCRDLICRVLSAAGLLVVPVPNGRAALAVLAHTEVDAVVSDINMPEVDGRSLCTALQADPRLKHLPVLLVSSVPPSAGELAALGAKFLAKPFAPGHLSHAVSELLGGAGTSSRTT
jgi:CheY-like chemotaxis protein